MKNIILLLLTGLSLLFLACGGGSGPEMKLPDIPVYETKPEEIAIYQEFVGQIYGYKDIAIRARVEGFLEGIYFKEGSRLVKGAKLYMVESQPFEADVAAKMSRVAEAKTMLAKAQSDLNRIRPLAEQNAVSQSDLDGAVAQYEASVASVEAAEANLRAARIQLGYTKIYSPISGIIGRTRAKVGDFVGREPNPVILNVVSRIDTILVQFFITEAQYLEVARYLQTVEDSIRHGRNKTQFKLILVDGSIYEHPGKLDFIDREVDPTTGAMLVQASFPNPDEILRPGQFAKIKARMAVLENGIMIPQRCIKELQGRFSVFIINEENKVEMRAVKVGPKISNFWVIKEGLMTGEKVVYEGIQKVKEGGMVNPIIQDIKATDQ
ncbi:MAG: efflux RND transporter periplasmic adaptor subunit [Calditrichia bacterium]